MLPTGTASVHRITSMALQQADTHLRLDLNEAAIESRPAALEACVSDWMVLGLLPKHGNGTPRGVATFDELMSKRRSSSDVTYFMGYPGTKREFYGSGLSTKYTLPLIIGLQSLCEGFVGDANPQYLILDSELRVVLAVFENDMVYAEDIPLLIEQVRKK